MTALLPLPVQSAAPVLSVKGLRVGFTGPAAKSIDEVIHGVDIELHAGETLAIVGESGCGKSLTAMAILGLLPKNARVLAGSITLRSQDVSALSDRKWREHRGRDVGVIFQDPTSSLNPVLSIGEQLIEAIQAHRTISRQAARERAVTLLHEVKLSEPQASLKLYPHQLSGGMRQRVMIAIAISNAPALLIADEPTTALDATVQEEILQLLHELQQKMGMAIMLITHDIGLVARWAHRAMVMYAGHVVEQRSTNALLTAAEHPYTRALLHARPTRRPADGSRPRLSEIPGRVPAINEPLAGCYFAPRCTLATNRCYNDKPQAYEVDSGWVACHEAAAGLISVQPITKEPS